MKKSFLLVVSAGLLLMSAPLDAQTTRADDNATIIELIRQNPGRANGSLCPYITPTDKYTKAPAGYKPVYISHIARHGSRYHQGMNTFVVIDTLKAFDQAGMLTPKGKEMLSDLELLLEVSKDHIGALTQVGGAEHQGTCERMYRNYRRVFKKRNTVNTYSTNAQRTLDSRSNFLLKLEELDPDLNVVRTQENAGEEARMEVVGMRIPRGQFNRDGINTDAAIAVVEDGLDPWHFVSQLVKDPSALSFDRAKWLMCNAISCGKNFINIDPENLPHFDKYYTPEELYYATIAASPNWFLKFADMANPATGAEYVGAGIVKRIIADADEALLPDSDIAATLRFSHDTYLLPLMTILGLTSFEEFVDFENICAACNVQLIFLRNRKDNVIVKIMKNEHECYIDELQAVAGPYYDWDDLKEYMLGLSPLVRM